MKTTLDLPTELIREMKLRAVMQGRTLRDLVADFLRQGLGLAETKATYALPENARVEISANGLPVIRGRASAPAVHMSLDELLAVEHAALCSEDMQRVGNPV